MKCYTQVLTFTSHLADHRGNSRQWSEIPRRREFWRPIQLEGTCLLHFIRSPRKANASDGVDYWKIYVGSFRSWHRRQYRRRLGSTCPLFDPREVVRLKGDERVAGRDQVNEKNLFFFWLVSITASLFVFRLRLMLHFLRRPLGH